MTVKKRLEAHNDRCRDCQACVLACSLHHEGQCNLGLARLTVSKDMERYTFDVRICRHCDEPACLSACPVEAMRQDERGVVILDEEKCVKCGACAKACPYDAIVLSENPEKRYLKCDLCAGRAEGPVCVEVCPVEAIVMEGAEALATPADM